MSLLKETSIRQRLYLAFACMWAIMIFFAFFRGQQLNTVMDRYSEAMTSINARQENIGFIVTTLNRLRFDTLMLGSFWEHPSFYEQLVLFDREAYTEHLNQYLDIQRELILTDTLLSAYGKAERILIIDNIYYTFNQQYLPTLDGIALAIESSNRELVNEALFINFTIGIYLQDLVWELRDATFDFTGYVIETMAYYDGMDERIFNIATLAGISLAIFLAFVLSHTIQNPITKLRFAVSEITSGNTDYPIRLKYNDDIGQLSHDIADMLNSISEMIKTTTEQNYRIEQQQQHEIIIKQALEESNAASKAKSTFVAHTSHEIRTPMNSIIGYSELALDDELPEKTRMYLEHILTNANWLLNIINDILDFSKIESGNLKLEEAPFKLNKVLEHNRMLMTPLALKKGLQLEISSQFSDNDWLLGDATKLGQITTNLLSNAIRFTNTGKVQLLVKTIKTNEEECSLKFEIIDTGVGISEKQIVKIFEEFTQADSNTNRVYGGTGLGLAISKRLIEAMGGELYAESVQNEGTKFSFILTLKITEGKNFEIFSDEDEAPVSRPHFNRGDVLVVEDNAMNIGVITAHLQRMGLNCTVAKNGKEAVYLVEKRIIKAQPPFDLIFMDINMPVMDGRDASAIISSLNTGTPIIAMTAEILSLTDRASYESCGMEGYISKPFTQKELWRCLTKYLA